MRSADPKAMNEHAVKVVIEGIVVDEEDSDSAARGPGRRYVQGRRDGDDGDAARSSSHNIFVGNS